MNFDTTAAVSLVVIAALYLAWRVRRYVRSSQCGCGSADGCPAARQAVGQEPPNRR